MATSPSASSSIQVVCLGLGRTGTASLRAALEILGFGPCYHIGVVVRDDGKSFTAWGDIGDGHGTPEAFDALFRDYSVVMDYPAAMYPRELYAAYPDAKFILTTRDPSTWERSMKATILRTAEILNSKPTKSRFESHLQEWLEKYMLGKYHRGRLYTHAQEEIRDHNERVKEIIPPEKLLVFDVSEGWDSLAKFLGVPKPQDPFPHVNDTKAFQEGFLRRLSLWGY